MARLVFFVVVISSTLLDVAVAFTCADGNEPTSDRCAALGDPDCYQKCTAGFKGANCEDTGNACVDGGGGQFFCCAIVETTAAPNTTTKATTKAAATTTASTCQDLIKTCSSYVDLCSNAAYQNMLNMQCAKTCGFCSGNAATTTAPKPSCIDAKTECTDWNKSGFCASSSYTAATKKAYCSKTCNLC